MKKIITIVVCLMFLLTLSPVYAQNAQDPDNAKIKLTVVFKDNQIDQAVKDEILKSGGSIICETPEIGSMQIEVNTNIIKKLQTLPSIQAVSPSIIMELPETQTFELSETDAADVTGADLYDKYQWDIKQVTNNGSSFEIEKGNHNVVVGIIDSGINAAHPALIKNAIGGRNFVEAGGTNNDPTETGDPNDYDDRNGHGSHVAGTIAGNGRILGVAPEVAVKAYRALDGKGSGYTSWITAAMIQAAKDGVDVISISIGGYNSIGQYWYTDPETGEVTKGHEVADHLEYMRAIKYTVDHGVTVVVSAGNDGINCANKSNMTDLMNAKYGKYGYKFVGAAFRSFSSIPGTVTVSATDPNKELASYSNYGAGYIDITAPGGDDKRYPEPDYYYDYCLSSYKMQYNQDGTPKHSYMWMAGTSMATPKVSAVAALIIAKYGKIGPEKVAHMLYQSSEDIGQKGKDIYYGNGLVNAYNAVK